MTSQPLFSVLIANYNNGKYINECIESVLNQTYKNWEIVIVDDASTDDSVKIINNLIKNDSRLIFHQNDLNIGCGGTKRKCVEIANGEVCGFLDPDDIIDDSTLKTMITEHIAHPVGSMVYSLNYVCDNFLEVKNVTEWGGELPKNESQLTSKSGQKITAFCSFKRKLYLKTEGINEVLKRAVDQDLYYKLEEVGGVFFVDKPLYYHRHHGDNISVGDNWVKAKYWNYIAVKKAYCRRKKKITSAKNCSYGDVQRMYLLICLYKISFKIRSRNFKNIFFYYYQILRLSIWDKELYIVTKHWSFLVSLLKS